MTTRAQIVAEARTWLGTRWCHRQSRKGVGVDCVGLVHGVGLAVGVIGADWRETPHVGEFIDYERQAHNGKLERGCSLFLQKLAQREAGPGDLVVMQFNGTPHHMGILGNYVHGGLSIIHAYAPRRCVIETRLDEAFLRRIVSWHRFNGVEA